MTIQELQCLHCRRKLIGHGGDLPSMIAGHMEHSHPDLYADLHARAVQINLSILEFKERAGFEVFIDWHMFLHKPEKKDAR